MIADELELKLQGESSFSVTMGKENVGFGHQKGKLATLVRLPSLLIELEKSVRDYFHSQKAWLVDETTKKRRAFRPHITNQKSGSMHEGDMFICDRLCIVEQKGGFKEIVGVVYLGK